MILSFDLGQTVGWACGDPDADRPQFGSIILPDGEQGRVLVALENEVHELLEGFMPTHVIQAAQLHLPAFKSMATAQRLFAMRGVVLIECYRAGISEDNIVEIEERRARWEVLNVSRPDAKTIKAKVMAWCKRQGWDVPDHHCGDAAVLWEMFRRQLVPSRRPQRELV